MLVAALYVEGEALLYLLAPGGRCGDFDRPVRHPGRWGPQRGRVAPRIGGDIHLGSTGEGQGRACACDGRSQRIGEEEVEPVLHFRHQLCGFGHQRHVDAAVRDRHESLLDHFLLRRVRHGGAQHDQRIAALQGQSHQTARQLD